MALGLSSSSAYTSPLPGSLFLVSPAKNRSFNLRPTLLVLRHHFSILSILSLKFFPVKPISSITPMNPLRSATKRRYVYPDPIPEFAEVETQKFKNELTKKLLKNKQTFGDDLDAVVEVCAKIFKDFLHKEYGGPGTLLVEPFTDMLVALKEKKLPGAPVAARAALLWAQNYVDQDWEVWTLQR